MKFKKNRLGFTLIELVVTTAIMGTLAIMAIPSYLENNTKAKMNKTVANISQIGSTLGLRFNELAADYRTVQLDTTSTPLDSAVNDRGIIKYGVKGTPNLSLTFGDIFPGGVLKSPFDDNPYLLSDIIAGAVTFGADESGNVTTIVIPAKITISDPEDATFLKASFSY